MKRMLAEVRAYKLRELREMMALTQTDVAETLSVSQKRVSEIERGQVDFTKVDTLRRYADALGGSLKVRSEAQTSELQSLMRISYAVFCLKKKTTTNHTNK